MTKSAIRSHLNACYTTLFGIIGVAFGILFYFAALTKFEEQNATIQQLRKEAKERQATVEALYQEKMTCLERKNFCENDQSELQTRLANAEKLLQGQD